MAFATLCCVQSRNHGHRGNKLDASQYYNHLPAPLMDINKLPKHFSWCSNGAGNLCTPSWNQHIPIYCGSCWAHGSTHMVQDRLKIHKKGMGPGVMLSRQALLNCGAYHGYGDGCNGGDVFDMFGYMTEFGLPDESCMIYTATDHHVFPEGLKQCPDTALCRNCNSNNESDPGTCWAIKEPIKYKLKRWGRIEPSNVHGMMSEIMQRGPITCSIACPDDFIWNYTGGVYTDVNNSTDVDHDVEVVGWGHEDGKDFWHVRNSWGTFWGELGFFKLERGVNTLQIESGDCWYAEPEYKLEEEVREGDLVGSMYGLIPRNHSAPHLSLA
ncbi:MAG: peptidase C1A family [Trebouxia sp. A1-2]|nr:MAG: peptidase C1A family [Trebouxia sp. A1-2]